MPARCTKPAASSSRGGRALIRTLFWCCWIAPLAAGQISPQERPLSNDSYLPVSQAAVENLRLGDAECLRALDAGAGADISWTRAFEFWHAALEDSAPGETVPAGMLLSDRDALVEAYGQHIDQRWPDRDHSFARRTEAVEYAVLRRLCGLDAPELARWSARFEPLAEERLRRSSRDAEATFGRRAAALAEVDRRFPATHSALRATVQLFELELEAGRLSAARVWLERARLHRALVDQDLTDDDSDSSRGLVRRARLLESLEPALDREAPAWSRGARFIPSGGHALVLPGRSKPRALARIEGQPGLAFLDDERVAVQTTGTLWVLSPDDKDRIFEPWRLGFELGQPISRTVDRTGKDWPMFPIAEGEALYLVCGRADGKSSNLLQKIRTPKELELPIAEWSLGGNGLYVQESEHLPLEAVLEAGMWEFQPGPLLVEDLLLVQARQWTRSERDGELQITTPGEARSWLLALDANTGKPRWKRFLCRGTDLVLDFGSRFGREVLIRTPGAALQATDTGVFVGTNLGAGFLVDIADGRIRWSFRNRRREADEPGWRTGARPTAGLPGAPGTGVILWASADSDELYPLSTALDFAAPSMARPAPIVRYPPLAIEESELLIGGTAAQALTLGRAGPRKTLSAHDLTSGRRFDSIYLAREETWLPGALLSDDRVLCVADGGLYLLDRQRELYLLAFQPLRIASEFAPGGLWARGNELFLLAQGALYTFVME